MGEYNMRDDKAQMMVLESIFFAITVVVALAFLVQISPTSLQSATQSSNELKTLGDDALDAIHAETMHVTGSQDADYITNNPMSKLAVCIITNNYTALVDSLNTILGNTIIYNIYISNGTKTVFWCTPVGTSYSTTTPQVLRDLVTISHHPISIDPKHLTDYSQVTYNPESPSGPNIRSDIWDDFINQPDPYDGATYEVILEMSYIWPS